MAPIRTRTDLVLKIIEKLGVLPDGQAPAYEETVKVDKNLESLMSELAGREIAYVPDLSRVPGAWFLSLADIAAYELRNEFGIAGEDEIRLEKANAGAIIKLKAMTRGRPTYQPMPVGYI